MAQHRKISKEARRQEKIITVILYVCRGLSPRHRADKHSIFKTIYLADRAKLAEFGVPVIEDEYIKMEFGPVPSLTRAIVQKVICDPKSRAEYFDTPAHQLIGHEGDIYLVAQAEPDMRYLSKTDIEFLDKAIETIKDIGVGPASMDVRTAITHDYAWESVERVGEMIPTEAILVAGHASEEVISLYKEHQQLKSLLKH